VTAKMVQTSRVPPMKKKKCLFPIPRPSQKNSADSTKFFSNFRKKDFYLGNFWLGDGSDKKQDGGSAWHGALPMLKHDVLVVVFVRGLESR